MRRLALIWGVIPILGKKASTTDEMVELAVDSVIQAGNIRLGDIVVITAGVPVGRSGTTNLIKVHHVGEMLAKGQGIGTTTANGHVVTARTPEEANSKISTSFSCNYGNRWNYFACSCCRPKLRHTRYRRG
jgi:pyruvate kinase